MTIYAVFLDDEGVPDWNTLLGDWARSHHVVSDNLVLIASDEPLLTSDICSAVGIGSDDRSGLVMEVAANYGYYYKSLWEWMDKFE